MSSIYLTRAIPEPCLSLLRERGHVVTVNSKDRALTHVELIKELKAASYDGVICLLNDTIDALVFDAAKSVKIYANYAVGFNNIDTTEAKRRGITITNTPSDAVNESVAEHTMALIMALTHRVMEGDEFVRQGKYKGWDPNLMIGEDIKGKTLGVIGAGHIGAYVMQKAVQGFGMKVIYFDMMRNERVERDYGAIFVPSTEDVLKAADIVTLHVLLTEQTRHLIDARRLSMMKPSAYLINTSRGPVVDEHALADALSRNEIRGAAMDVYEFEPKVSKRFTKLMNVVMTPHIASATAEARADMSRIVAANLISFFDGSTPANSVQ